MWKDITTLCERYYRELQRFLLRRRLDGGPLHASFPSAEVPVDARIETQQQVDRLRQAMEELPPKTRAVYILYRVDGLSYRDIAAALDISPRTVEYHLRQALIQCRQRLTQEQDPPSARAVSHGAKLPLGAGIDCPGRGSLPFSLAREVEMREKVWAVLSGLPHASR